MLINLRLSESELEKLKEKMINQHCINAVDFVNHVVKQSLKL